MITTMKIRERRCCTIRSLLIAILFLIATRLAKVNSGATSSLKITSVEAEKYVIVKRNAVLSWIITSRGDVDVDVIKCSAKTHSNMVVTVVQTDKQTGNFVVRIPQESQLKFNHRLKAKHYSRSSNSIVIELTIENAEFQDTGVFECSSSSSTTGSSTSTASSAEVHLQVYSELNEIKRFEPVVKIEGTSINNGRDAPRTILCAVPEPRVTMKFKGTTQRLEGRVIEQNNHCYGYTIENITLIHQQKHCGEVLEFEFKGVKKIIRRRVTIEIPLEPKPPENAVVTVKRQDDKLCFDVRWDGPNIGTCKAASLSYEVVVTQNEATILREMVVYSNRVEICEIDFAKSGVRLKVRTSLGGENSTWTQAKVVSDADAEATFLYSHMRIVIIGCGAVVVLLLILLIVHCVYTHKRSCCRKRGKGRTDDEDEYRNENTPLKEFSQIEKGVVHPQEPTKQETSKRKISRKASTNDTAALMANASVNNSVISNGGGGGGRKNSTHQEPHSKKDNTKKNSHNNQHSQHDKRFYSLQRNIEREKKKLEELDFEQQEEEYYAQRRNTDSRILQDLRNTFCGDHYRGSLDHQQHQKVSHHNHHHPRSLPASGNSAILLSPSSLHHTPYLSIAGDIDDYDRQRYFHPVTATPVYDILPRNSNTRSTASTSSSTATGGRRSTFHEDFDDASSSRKRYTNDSGAFSSENDPSPVYDVLPRSNTNLMVKQQQQTPKTFNNYDVLPSTNSNLQVKPHDTQRTNSSPSPSVNTFNNYDVLPSTNSNLQVKPHDTQRTNSSPSSSVNTFNNYDVLPSTNSNLQVKPHDTQRTNSSPSPSVNTFNNYDVLPSTNSNLQVKPHDTQRTNSSPSPSVNTSNYDVLPSTNSNLQVKPHDTQRTNSSPSPSVNTSNYDVLPSTNTAKQQTFENANQAYDFIPPFKRNNIHHNSQEEKQNLDNPYQVPSETIYDVPARPSATKQTIEATAPTPVVETHPAAPFSSHRKNAITT